MPRASANSNQAHHRRHKRGIRGRSNGFTGRKAITLTTARSVRLRKAAQGNCNNPVQPISPGSAMLKSSMSAPKESRAKASKAFRFDP
jgi:hypothetical protein